MVDCFSNSSHKNYCLLVCQWLPDKCQYTVSMHGDEIVTFIVFTLLDVVGLILICWDNLKSCQTTHIDGSRIKRGIVSSIVYTAVYFPSNQQCRVFVVDPWSIQMPSVVTNMLQTNKNTTQKVSTCYKSMSGTGSYLSLCEL